LFAILLPDELRISMSQTSSHALSCASRCASRDARDEPG
jgi:hypothetical protein